MGKLLVCLLVAGLVLGCGGKVERSSGSSAATGRGGEPGWPSTQLGECVPGTPRTSASSCVWMAEGDCYPDKLAACNCICPADKDSVCASDYPEPGKPTLVSCE